MNKISILLIEDNEDIALLIKHGLLSHAIEVTVAATGAGALQYLTSNKSLDLILLDLMLPDISGFDLLPKIKKLTEIPIVIVSAKNGLKDKINGIEIGADDYISKPFHMDELVVRIKARLRKHFGEQGMLKIGIWKLDRDHMQAFDPNGIPANLTPKEFLLVELLASKPNKVITREQLLTSSRDDYTDISERAIDTQLSRVRTKLKLGKQVFQAIRGIGYIYNYKVGM
jgi:two-component system copper resistance phosphate regulon response regulator CusR